MDTTLYADVPEFCQSVKILKKDKVRPEDVSIEEKDFALTPSKYIEFIDHDLDIDYDKEMARIRDEMRLLMDPKNCHSQCSRMHLGGLAMALTEHRLGEFIELRDVRNSDLQYGADDVRGVNNLKLLMSTKADLEGRDLSKFQIVYPDEFVFNHRTSRNGSKFSIATMTPTPL